MPMYLDVITAVGNILITPLGISKPGPKVLLHEKLTWEQGPFSSSDLWAKLFYLGFNVRFIHIRILIDIGKSIDKKCVL